MRSLQRFTFESLTSGWLGSVHWLRRLSPIPYEALGAAILLVLVTTGFAWVSTHPADPTQGNESNEVPASAGIIARSEVIHLWLPESIWELTRPQSQIQPDPATPTVTSQTPGGS